MVTALAVSLTACGDDSDTAADPGSSTSSATSATSSTPSADPTSESPAPSSSSSAPPSGPACSKVWKEGADLPRLYRGCVDGDQFVERDVLSCSSGQAIARYADHFYGALGGRVYRTESVLDKDRGYRDSVAVCRG